METCSKRNNGRTALEKRVDRVFTALHTTVRDRKAIKAFLAPLRNKDAITHEHYLHSLRVGLMAEQIGRFMHLDSKALFYAGLLHDIGKCQTPLAVLGKKGAWTQADAEAIKVHVIDSYRMIRDRFGFTAEIVLLHHIFQAFGYPSVLPPFLREYREGAKVMIKLCGYLLAVADVYDAYHRDDKVAGKRRTGRAIRAGMLKHFPDQRKLVEDLYGAGILTIFS